MGDWKAHYGLDQYQLYKEDLMKANKDAEVKTNWVYVEEVLKFNVHIEECKTQEEGE